MTDTAADRPDASAPLPGNAVVAFWLATYVAIAALGVFLHSPGAGAHAFGRRALVPAGAAALAWLVLAGFCAPATWRSLAEVVAALRRELGPGKLAALGALTLVGWIHPPSPDWLVPGLAEMALRLAANASGLVLLVLLARRAAAHPGFVRAIGAFGDAARRMPTAPFLAIAAIWCLLACALLGHTVLGAIPHVPDEAAYLFQARLFAGGHLVSRPAGELSALLRPQYVWDDPYGYSVFPPGWPAVLALGVAAGAPWWVNPLLAAGCVPFLYRFSRDLVGAARARAAVLLLCVCPFFLFLSASLFSHTLTLFTGLVAGAGFRAGRNSVPWALAGGAALALLFVTRPMEGTLLAGAMGVAVVIALVRRESSWRRVPLFAIALAGPLAWLAWNHAVGRSWGDVPVDRYFASVMHVSNKLGFGADRGMTWRHNLGPGHTPLEGLFNLQLNVAAGNDFLWGWPGGAAALVALGLLAGGSRRVPRALLLTSAALVAAYLLYWYHGEALGPRFYFLLLPVAILLTLSGLEAAGRALRAPAAVVVAVGLPFALLVHLPVLGGSTYHDLRGVSLAAQRQVLHPPASPALVLAREGGVDDYFGSAVPLNDPDLRAPVLYARDRDRPEDVGQLARAFPDRYVYRFRDRAWTLLRPPVPRSAP